MYLNKIKFFENIIFVILISLLLTNFAKADLIKPNSGIEPIQVVKIQLRGLKNNDQLYQDGGIEQTWEFAHPKNRKFTGPLTKFKSMIKGDDFSMLLNHKEHKVKEVFLSDDVATFEVIVLIPTSFPQKNHPIWVAPIGGMHNIPIKITVAKRYSTP